MSEGSDLAADAEFIRDLVNRIKSDFETLEANVRNLPVASNPNTHQASLESLLLQRDYFLQEADRIGQLLVDTAAFHLSLDRLRSTVDRFIEDTGGLFPKRDPPPNLLSHPVLAGRLQADFVASVAAVS